MLRGSVAAWPVPRGLATVGEVAAMAASARRLLRAVRAGRASELVPIDPPELVNGPRATTPVLLVHGYLGTPDCWSRLVPQLHRAGFVTLFGLGYNSLASTIPVLAADVVRAAETAMHEAHADHIHLVGHSLGGLVIRYAVQRLGLSPTVGAVVTIATPHHGSHLAAVAPGVVGAQMRPGSSLLAHLPPLSATSGVSWLVVDSAQDIVVSKTTTSAPSAPHGPDGVVRYRLVEGRGHQAVLRSAELGRTVVDHLVDAERVRGRLDEAA
jgi:pimeloyl-ACP methyl ester carboxylesterase